MSEDPESRFEVTVVAIGIRNVDAETPEQAHGMVSSDDADDISYIEVRDTESGVIQRFDR